MFRWESEAVEKDSDLKCESKSLDPSEIYHLGIKHFAIHKIWNAVACSFKSPSGYSFS